MSLVQSLVLSDEALVSLKHLVEVFELVDEEYGLVAHYWIDRLKCLNRHKLGSVSKLDQFKRC